MPADQTVIEKMEAINHVPESNRVPNSWQQIWQDLVSEAPYSGWGLVVTDTRIRDYDRIRTFVTRGTLLAAMAILLAFAPGTHWYTFALMLPALLQTVLEIYLDFQLYAEDPSELAAVRKMVDVAQRNHTLMPVNYTGLIGGIAVPCNLFTVAFCTGPGSPEWVKVVAYAAAAMYGTSGILGVALDSNNFAANQTTAIGQRIYQSARPHLWLVAVGGMAVFTLTSILCGRWAPAMEPMAWALCVIPVTVGMKQRDYDRMVRLTGQLLPEVQYVARSSMARDAHDIFTTPRQFLKKLAVDEGVPAPSRVLAAALAPQMSLVDELADPVRWHASERRIALTSVAAKTGSDAKVELVCELSLDHVNVENYHLARQLVTTLLFNAGHALELNHVQDKTVRVFGAQQGDTLRLEVSDPLPLIADWCAVGSTLLLLEQRLRQVGGALSQREGSHGKTICATWPVIPPAPPLGGPRR